MNGWRKVGILRKDEYIDADVLDKAIADKNIIIRNKNDFNSIPGFNPKQYSEIYEGKDLFGNMHWFCIKVNYIDVLRFAVYSIT